ncbi:hypothetical protein HK104_010987 [Borealophlyctis nickersoniae]|nr:hypothetical protein HK104_010987 [Borealophlyctis nickersoniae]
MFHPLIDKDGTFRIDQQFPTWRPRKDYICHVLHYMKNSFKEAVLANLQEQFCPNKQALKMFLNERPVFARLASQCAQLSASESILFDSDDGSAIQFSPLGDAQFEELRNRVLNSPVS